MICQLFPETRALMTSLKTFLKDEFNAIEDKVNRMQIGLISVNLYPQQGRNRNQLKIIPYVELSLNGSCSSQRVNVYERNMDDIKDQLITEIPKLLEIEQRDLARINKKIWSKYGLTNTQVSKNHLDFMGKFGKVNLDIGYDHKFISITVKIPKNDKKAMRTILDSLK